MKLTLGDEVHLNPPNSGDQDTRKALVHRALMDTNYEFKTIPRQLKRFAEAASEFPLVDEKSTDKNKK